MILTPKTKFGSKSQVLVSKARKYLQLQNSLAYKIIE
jgi:hypothetical protein